MISHIYTNIILLYNCTRPCAYTKPALIGGSNAPSYTMNGRAKPDKQKENIPGPASYNIPSTVQYNSNNAVKIKGRYDDIKLFDKQTPGYGNVYKNSISVWLIQCILLTM